MEKTKNIILFNMNGNLWNQDKTLFQKMEKLRNLSGEKVYFLHSKPYLKKIKERGFTW